MSQGNRDKAAFLKCWGPDRHFVSFLHWGKTAQLRLVTAESFQVPQKRAALPYLAFFAKFRAVFINLSS